MKNFGVFLIVVAVVLFIVAGIMTNTSYDRLTNYSNSEYSFMKKVNVHVGGDAYNFIINGTHATTYAIYAMTLAIVGGLFLVSGAIIILLEKQNKNHRITNPESSAKRIEA